MDRRKFLIAGAGALSRLALPAGIVAVAGCSGTQAPRAAAGFEGTTMGTGFSVRLSTSLEADALADLRAAVEATLAQVDARMSTYKPGSELSRFNRESDTGWQPLSGATARVVATALDFSRNSAGAFDATVGPLVDRWGFGPSQQKLGTPGAREVGALLERVGWHNVDLHPSGAKARKQRADTSLDLSGIAKGHGVDAVAERLEVAGVGDFLVEVGGELKSRGMRPGGGPWRVAIERPTPGQRSVQRVIDLAGRAIATSGDYRNFYHDGGRRYAHTIDPRSGKPVDHALASVSVIADSAMQADAASTTLMVLGPEAGPEWAAARGIAAHFLTRDGARLREFWTPAFERHLVA